MPSERIEAFLAEAKALLERAPEVFERAGKHSVWQKLRLFFEGERQKDDRTAQFILEWAEKRAGA